MKSTSILIAEGTENLKTVKLSPRWSPYLVIRPGCLESPDLSKAFLNGSPLARSWNLFPARPCPWDFIDEEFKPPGMSDGTNELRFLSHALLKAKIRPRRLRLGRASAYGLPPPVFDSSSQSLGMSKIFTGAYQKVTHIKLHMANCCGVSVADAFSDLTGLGCLLRSLTNLEYLHLDLPYGTWSVDGVYHRERHYTYDQIFAKKAGLWPKIHTFVIHNLGIGTQDLVRLLSDGMPQLNNFQIRSSMDLLDGRWEWIIEHMRHIKKLRRFIIYPGTELICPDDQTYLLDRTSDGDFESDEYYDIMVEVEDYVLNGGRHPGLLPHQPDDASHVFIQELDDFLYLAQRRLST